MSLQILMNFLKRNALKFLEEAKESFKKEDYAFAMLFVEQAVQLALKYLLARRFGDFPRTHSLKLLFELTGDDGLMAFYRENVDLIREIELAYIASRYTDVEYTKAVVERALQLAERLMGMIE